MKKLWCLCLLSVCLIVGLVGPAVAQTTVNLQASADTTIYGGSAETGESNGGGTAIFVGQITGANSGGNPPAGTERRGLIRFDVSSIPAGSTITSVSLELFVTNRPAAFVNSTIAMHQLTGTVLFGEGTTNGGGGGAVAVPPDATWVNRETSTPTAWGTAGGDFNAASASVLGAFAPGETVRIPGLPIQTTAALIADVQAWVDGTETNVGWALIGSGGNGSVRGYASSENGTVAARPELSVTYLSPVDLTISKSDTVDPVLPNSAITYTISVTNNGESTATGTITVNENLDDATTFVSASGSGWTCGTGDTFTCTRTADLAGETTAPAITVVATAPGTATTVTNNVSVSTPDTESSTGNNSASQSTTVAAGADLQITKSESADPTEIGTTLTYTLNVTNAGPDTAGSVTVTDTLPTGFSAMVSDNGGFTCGQAAGVITCTLSSFSPGSTSIVFSGTAPSTPTTLTNEADIASSETLDPNLANNSTSITTDIVSQANLTVTKAVSSPGGAFTKGSAVVYTVTISNSGPHAQLDNAGNEFEDTLPPSLENVSASIVSGGGTLGGSGNTVTWNGTIAANASVVIQIDATIADTVSVGDDISNQATVNFDPNGDGTSESSASSDDPATGAADDPTVFVVSAFIAEVPTASTAGLLLLMLLLGGAATVLLRR